MNGDYHNPNLPYNLYLYNNLIPNKAIKVPLNHKKFLELLHLSII